MERRSNHLTSQNHNSRQQSNDNDKRRSTWHPSQTIASRRQPSNESTNVSLQKEFINAQVQEPISGSDQLVQESITKQLSRQSIANGPNFDSRPNDTSYKSSHVSMVEGSMESPRSTNELLEHVISCELPIQSTRESTIQSVRQSVAVDQTNSFPYGSTCQIMGNSSTPQTMAIRTTQPSTIIVDQMDSPYRSSHQSIATRSARQSNIHEPIVHASNVEVQLLEREAWEDDNTSTQPLYASTQRSMAHRSARSSRANQSPRQPTTNQSKRQSLASQTNQQSTRQNHDVDTKEFEGTNQPYEYRSNHQSIIENHLNEDDGQNLQNQSPYKLVRQSIANPSIQQSMVEHSTRQSIASPPIQQSIIDHSTRQSSNRPSTRQSMGNDFMPQSTARRSTRQSSNQSSDDDTQVFDRNSTLPYQHPSARHSTADRHTRQSTANQSIRSSSSSPSNRQSIAYISNQPSNFINEDTSMLHNEIWPEVLRQQAPYGSTGQSMINRSSMGNRFARQSTLNKSTRPSTVHGYNVNNQTWNDIRQSNVMPSKSTRQSMAARSIRPSTTDGRISYGRTLESESEIPSFKSIQQTMTNKSTRQSRSNSPSSDVEIFESDDLLLISSPYESNRQSMVSTSNSQFVKNPSVRQSMAPQSNRQSMANRSIRQSTGDQSTKQSMIERSRHQSAIDEYDSRRPILYSEENSLDVPPYQLNQQSMASRSTRQSRSNKHIQPFPKGNYEFRLNDCENLFSSNQSPSQSTQQSIVNQSTQQSKGNRSARQSAGMRSMQPSVVDHQNAEVQMYDNQIPKSQQSMANRSMQQSIVEGVNTEAQMLKDDIYPKQVSIGERSAQHSYENRSTQPSMVLKSAYQLSNEYPNIDPQILENETQSIRQSTADRSARQSRGNKSIKKSMDIRSMRPSAADHQIANIQMFEDEVPHSRQSMANRSFQQSMANRSTQQSNVGNLNAEVQMLNNEIYPSQISVGERLVQQSQGNRSAWQSMGFRSPHQSTIVNPNLELYMLNEEPQTIGHSAPNRSIRQSQGNRSPRQSMGFRSPHQSTIVDPNLKLHMQNDDPQSIGHSVPNRSAQQSQGNRSGRQSQENKSTCQLMGGRSTRESTMDDQNLELQILDDDIQLSRSPHMSSGQSMDNRSSRLSIRDRSIQQFSGDKSTPISIVPGLLLEPNFLNDENIMREESLRSVRQSMGNMSSHHSIAEGSSNESEMLGSKVHITDPQYGSVCQSMGEAQESRRSSFDEHLQNQINEGEFSRLASYSGDRYQPEKNNEDSKLNLEPSQSLPTSSRFVTLEVRSNVQKESLDKFLIGGWDSVTLKIPPEMHSLLHGIRNSLSCDNPNLDLEQHMTSIAEGNNGQCSANIRILYSGIYNSNQEPTNSDLYEQSRISHIHSGSDSSNCPSCNAEKEQGTVRFNIEES